MANYKLTCTQRLLLREIGYYSQKLTDLINRVIIDETFDDVQAASIGVLLEAAREDNIHFINSRAVPIKKRNTNKDTDQ